MSQIHIGRGTVKLGIFSREDVVQGLQSGKFLPTDVGWEIGMEEWTPLSVYPDLIPEPPQISVPDEGDSTVPSTAEPTGLPWDQRNGIFDFKAYWLTFKKILIHPPIGFSEMKLRGDIFGALLFALPTRWLGFLVSLGCQVILESVFPKEKDSSLLHMTGMSPWTFALLAPFIILVILPVFSGILHFCLLLTGGTRQPYETTLRAVCFTTGVSSVFRLIPLFGDLIAIPWEWVTFIFALTAVHRCDRTKSIAAVVMTGFACCFCLIAVLSPGVAVASAKPPERVITIQAIRNTAPCSC